MTSARDVPKGFFEIRRRKVTPQKLQYCPEPTPNQTHKTYFN